MSYPSAVVIGRSFQSSRTARRRFLTGAATLPLVLASGQAAYTHQASPDASPTLEDTDSLLAVADPASARILYRVSDLAQVGEFDAVVGQTHAGILPMPDGSLLFVDERSSPLMAVIVADGRVAVDAIASVPAGVSHFAIDSEHAPSAAVGTSDPAAPIVFIDLVSRAIITVALPEPGEIGLMLTHDTLFHRNDVRNHLEAYPLSELVSGATAPVSTVAIGTGGHGESIDPTTGMLYCATDDNIDAVLWTGEELRYGTTYSWSDDASVTGRGYFQRLTSDGEHIVTYIYDRAAAPTKWGTRANHAMMVGIEGGTVLRPELGNGYVYRFGLANDLALCSVMGGSTDEVVVLDLRRGSDTFGTITARIPLAPMFAGPQPDESIYDVGQYRAVTVTPDGSTGFVAHRGDGMVSILDLTRGTVSAQIDTSAPLDGGRYLTVFGTAASFMDTIAR
jgi:hypothetical protein